MRLPAKKDERSRDPSGRSVLLLIAVFVNFSARYQPDRGGSKTSATQAR